MERRKRKHGKDYWIAFWGMVVIIGVYLVGFLLHSIIWYTVCWAFQWAFTWRVSLGVYLILCMITWAVWAGRGRK